MKRNHYLSKSQYIRGMQCHKSLYLYKHHKELRDDISAAQQAIFSSGTNVGVLACDLFPGGIEVPFEGMSIPEQVAMTQREIVKGTKAIYEASFEHNGLFVKVDILHKGKKGWELYEVKSAGEVKEVNYDDVALQYYVLKGAGIDLHKACLVHVNTSYVRNGDIEVDKLFTINDLTDDVVAMQDDVPSNLAAMRGVLDGATPQVDIGNQCSKPYRCDFHGHCWQHIPKDSVFDLAGHGINKFDYNQRGLSTFEDLPLNELNASQRFQVEKHLQKGEHVDPKGLNDFLGTLWYPLCHFDFETFMSPVPLYDGTRPYRHVPFQYSLHIQREEGGPIEHYEYLAEPNVDPRPEMIKQMLHEIPEDACVLAYYMSFEKGRIEDLIEDFPEHTEGLSRINENVRDLIVPFKKRYAYRWEQYGSNSIKKVLPAFIPELSYQDLEISDGGMAMEAYHVMCAEQDAEKLTSLRKALLAYCGLDTEAMVMLHKKLGELSVQS
jgi:hypothetical protein